MASIFVSHSSADKDLIAPIQDALEELGVNGYFAEFTMQGRPIPEKLREAIRASTAVVVLWTRNVSDVQRTRDVVIAEMFEAHMAQKPVYMFHEEGTDVPMMISYITDYFTFSKTTVKEALRRVRGLAGEMKQNEDFLKAVGITLAAVAIVAAAVGVVWYLTRRQA